MAIFGVIDTGNLADTFYQGMVKDAANWVIMEAAKPCALGSANFKKFVNAGATSEEWAKGIKAVAYTRDLTALGAPTTVAYTGAGFKPGAALVIGGISTTTPTIGFTDFTLSMNFSKYGDHTWYVDAGMLVSGWVDIDNYQRGAVVSADADGMSISWTKALTPTGTLTFYVYYFR